MAKTPDVSMPGIASFAEGGGFNLSWMAGSYGHRTLPNLTRLDEPPVPSVPLSLLSPSPVQVG